MIKKAAVKDFGCVQIRFRMGRARLFVLRDGGLNISGQLRQKNIRIFNPDLGAEEWTKEARGLDSSTNWLRRCT